MIQLMVRMTAVPGHSADIIQALRGLTRTLHNEGACSSVHLASDVDDSDVVWYCEEWPSVQAFERHLRSARFARVLSVIETGATTPQLECRLVSETRGLEYIAAVRADLNASGAARIHQHPAGTH